MGRGQATSNNTRTSRLLDQIGPEGRVGENSGYATLHFVLLNNGFTQYSRAYGRKSVDRIGTQSMSRICNLWRLIVEDCDFAESYGRFVSGGNDDASHTVYIVSNDS